MTADLEPVDYSRRTSRSRTFVWGVRILVGLGAFMLFQLAGPASAGPGDVVVAPGSVISHSMGEVGVGPAAAIDQSGLSSTYTSGATAYDPFVASSPVNTGAGNRWSMDQWAGTVDLTLADPHELLGLVLWNGPGDNSWERIEVFSSPDPDFNDLTSLGSFNAAAGPVSDVLTAEELTFTSTSTTRYIRIEISSSRSATPEVGEIAFRASGANPEGAIAGRVFVAEDPPVPVADASIGLFQTLADGSRGPWIVDFRTAPDGTYRIPVQAGAYTLTFVAPDGETFVDSDMAFLDRATTVAAGETANVDAPLKPNPDAMAQITGEVFVDDEPRVPVAGIEIGLFQTLADGSRGPWLADHTTAADGTYDLSLIPGAYTLTFIAPDGETFVANDMAFLDRSATVAAGESATIDAALNPDLAMRGAISGRVYAQGDPIVPAADALIGLFETNADGSRGPWLADARTVADGTYQLSLNPGSYTLTFVAPDGETFVDTGIGFLDGTAVVTPGSATQIDAVLGGGGNPAPAEIRGRMFTGGNPVSPAADQLVGLFETQADGSRGTWIADARTGADGTYSFPVGGGVYTLTFIAPDGETFVANDTPYLDAVVTIADGETVDVDAELNPNGGPANGRIQGRMFTGGDPITPAADELVVLFATNADGSRGSWISDSRTGADGTYTISIEPGTYTVNFVAPDGRTFVANDTPFLETVVVVSEGAIVEADAELTDEGPDPQPGRIEGQMYVEGNPVDPAPNELVGLFEAMADGSRGPWIADARTAADGSYDFTVDADSYVVTFSAPNGMTFVDNDTSFLEATVEVADGATTQLNAALNDDSDPGPGPNPELLAIDWWGCWQAADARNSAGQTPQDGQLVASLPNCASGPSSVGSQGDMSHASAPPIFRSAGADGNRSIEFTFDGNTLLQTNGGQSWGGGAVLPGSSQGVTLAWVGMVSDVNSHSIKYLVSGLNGGNEHPMLIVEGEGPNRFLGYGGGATEARSSNGTVVDYRLHGVIMYLAPNGSASIVEIDGVDVNGGQDSRMTTDVTGLTLGNIFSRGFSTTDHQFVFLGMHEGQMSSAEKSVFWEYVNGL